MLNGIGPTGFILIILVALLLFGPSKLPELGRAFGRTLREFKDGARDMMSDEDKEKNQPRKEIRSEEVKVSETKTEQPQQDNNKRLPE